MGCGTRDVSECASWLRKSGTILEQLEAMSEAEAGKLPYSYSQF